MAIDCNVLSIFTEKRAFIISTHISPDGDGIGSALALSRGLRALGKNVVILNHSKTPKNLHFMLLSNEEIITPALLPADFDPREYLSVVVDMGAFDRLGSVLPIIEKTAGLLVIDHHIVEIPEGVSSLIEPSACATGEIIFELLKLLKIHLDRKLAEPLYAAIETDTGGFRFSGTTPRTHILVAELLKTGIDPGRIYTEIYEKQSAVRLRLMGEIFSTLWVSPKGKLACMELRHSMLNKLGAQIEDGDDLVNYLMTIDGVEAGFYFKELSPGRTKISCRSRNGLNLGEFLAEWGGGGHAFAAGLLIEKDIETSKRIIINKALDILE